MIDLHVVGCALTADERDALRRVRVGESACQYDAPVCSGFDLAPGEVTLQDVVAGYIWTDS